MSTFAGAVQRQAAQTPTLIAIRDVDGAVSYEELNRRANQVAHHLRARGVGPETTVGICMERNRLMIIALLGVLKAGGAYVPLDPGDPEHRRDLIRSDADLALVLTASDVAAIDAGPDDDLPVPDGADRHAAYLLYTSGSTGVPKGVVVENRHLMAYVDAVSDRLGLAEPMSFAMVQPLSVDSSVTAFAPTLCHGGQVHLIPRESALDPVRLADWCRRWGVDALKIAPSHLRTLQNSPRFAELLPRRVLIVGGEASDWRWMRELQRVAPDCRVINHYGPTETTVGVTTFSVAEHLDETGWDVTPIGTPLPGVRIQVVDEAGRPVADGEPGELLVGGPQVARGYRNRDDLTAGAFIADPFAPEPAGRLYRTGDMVIRQPDGNVVFLGRRDDQIKIRGFRVAIGEIDAALHDHAGVRLAATIVREDSPGETRVVSYIEPGPDFDDVGLQAHLRRRLPAHMIPSTVVTMPRLPLSSHGKVDRSALPVPPAVEDARAPLGDGLPARVADIWRDLLKIDAVDPELNFFDAGGHSLLLVELQHRLGALTGQQVDLMDLFQHTTIHGQAQLIGQRPAATTEKARTPQRGALAARLQQQKARRTSS
jgi:amino acid adenylation domain-containing protein